MALVVDGIPLQIEAAVSDTLPVSVLLGTDIPELDMLLWKQTLSQTREQEAEALIVTTRAQAKQQVEEAAVRALREAESGVRAHPVSTAEAEADSPAPGDTEQTSTDKEGECTVFGSDVASDLFTPGRETQTLSMREATGKAATCQ